MGSFQPAGGDDAHETPVPSVCQHCSRPTRSIASSSARRFLCESSRDELCDDQLTPSHHLGRVMAGCTCVHPSWRTKRCGPWRRRWRRMHRAVAKRWEVRQRMQAPKMKPSSSLALVHARGRKGCRFNLFHLSCDFSSRRNGTASSFCSGGESLAHHTAWLC